MQRLFLAREKANLVFWGIVSHMFLLQALILAEGRATQLQPEFSVVVTAKLYQFGRDGFAFISLSSVRWFATTSDALTCFCSTFHCRQEVAASSVVDIEIQSALHTTAHSPKKSCSFGTFWNVASWTGKVAKQTAQWSNSSGNDSRYLEVSTVETTSDQRVRPIHTFRGIPVGA